MLEGDLLFVNQQFAISLQRTVRVPDDGKSYPLPPGLGRFPIFQVADFRERLPGEWNRPGSVFIPMYQREALWIGFRAAPFRPHAVKVAIGGVNALTGAPHDRKLGTDPQDYVVCPPQVWLDGIRTESGMVRQFVAVPLGRGRSIEAALTGVEVRGGIQLVVFPPRPGVFPEQAPPAMQDRAPMRSPKGGMGFGAGGEIAQKIYPDPHGVATWDSSSAIEFEVQVLNSLEFRLATGGEPPATPVDAQSYSARGLPWFELYDETLGDLPASNALRGVTTLAEYRARSGELDEPAESSLMAQGLSVQTIRGPRGPRSPDRRSD